MAAGRCSARERFGRLKFRLAQSNEFGLIDLNCLRPGVQFIKVALMQKSQDNYSVFPMSFGMRSVRQFLTAAPKIIFGLSEAMTGWLRKAKA
jgi:hypothetical protein